MFTLAELEHAQRQIHTVFPGTAQYQWPILGQRLGADVWVKHENHTPTGAFKVRGGLIYMRRLAEAGAASNGIVSATRGNHGQSLAFAGARFGIPVTIVVPHGNSREKNTAMRALGARLVEHGDDFESARLEAIRLAEQRGQVFAPSFHADLVLGVATWALELLRAAPGLDRLYVPIGMGSGICGAVLVRDLLGLQTRIIGVQSAGAPAYARSLSAGRVVGVDSAITHADGVAVRVPDPAAFAIIQRGVAEIVTVTDNEVAHAIRVLWQDTHNLAEGAGALPLAAMMRENAGIAGQSVGFPLCGGNIDLDLFKRWVLAGPCS